jgi:hypothetical protein
MSAPSKSSGPSDTGKAPTKVNTHSYLTCTTALTKCPVKSPSGSQSGCGNAESPPTDVVSQDEHAGLRIRLWLDDVVTTSPVASNESPQGGSFPFPPRLPGPANPRLAPNRPQRPPPRSLSPLSLQILNFEQGSVAPTNDAQTSPQTWDSTGQVDDSSEDLMGHSALGLQMSPFLGEPPSTASRHPSPILHPGQQLLGRAIRSLGTYRPAWISIPLARSTI